jgi:hypothetical protein
MSESCPSHIRVISESFSSAWIGLFDAVCKQALAPMRLVRLVVLQELVYDSDITRT